MIRFIQQEANEKAEEIDAKVRYFVSIHLSEEVKMRTFSCHFTCTLL